MIGGVKIFNKRYLIILSIVLLLFIIVGSASATDLNDANDDRILLNSNVTIFMSQLPDEGSRLTRPGALAGGIFLTNEDTLMVWGFPRTIDKDILKLFNIK